MDPVAVRRQAQAMWDVLRGVNLLRFSPAYIASLTDEQLALADEWLDLELAVEGREDHWVASCASVLRDVRAEMHLRSGPPAPDLRFDGMTLPEQPLPTRKP